ncbi:MAG: DDE-type integrase/transposase/recombinase [Bacteroidetes bacterium]|nr:DDE-type integrase/transposase/recombinase [Bacteroidota bacterium]
MQPSLRSRSPRWVRQTFFSSYGSFTDKATEKLYQDHDSKHWRKYPNLIKDRTFDRAEQLWVSDITYIKTKQGNSYLSLVTDAVSRKIGHHLRTDRRSFGIRMAIKNRNYNGPLIHHSDRGLQYCSYDYQTMLGRTIFKRV